ncbi:MAG: hypothetical protein RIG82_00750 [Phycisphaeraceae bacterium]
MEASNTMERRRFRLNRPQTQAPERPDRPALPRYPMLLGEPSPSLAKIRRMTIPELQKKISSLGADQPPLLTKLEKLRAKDPIPAEDVKETETHLKRLQVLESLAKEQLEKLLADREVRR